MRDADQSEEAGKTETALPAVQRHEPEKGEKPQRGLIETIPNPTGRRMKAVALTAAEILSKLQKKMLAVGLFRSLGNERRQKRVKGKVWALAGMLQSEKDYGSAREV